jgi:hypothetical protein
MNTNFFTRAGISAIGFEVALDVVRPAAFCQLGAEIARALVQRRAGAAFDPADDRRYHRDAQGHLG